MPRRLSVVTAALALACALRAPAARACDSASCVLVTRAAGVSLPKHKFTVDLSFRYSNESKRLSGSSTTDDVVLPRIDFDGTRILPGFHREVSGNADSLQADVGFGVTSRLTALVSLPLFGRKSYEHTHLPAPTPSPAPGETPTDPGHEDHGPAPAGVPVDRAYRTDGFGDTLLGMRYEWPVGASERLFTGVGLELPTGESRAPNTYDGGLHDPMMQPGTGAFGVLMSALYVHGRGPLTLSASASEQLMAANDLDYRFGNETILAMTLTRTLRAVYSRSMVSASVQVKGHFRGRSEYLGEPVPSTGYRMLILSPGLRLTTPGGTGFYTYLQLPVYSYVNEAQLSTRASLLAGISRTF